MFGNVSQATRQPCTRRSQRYRCETGNRWPGRVRRTHFGVRLPGGFELCPYSARYLMSVSILNIGRYIAITIVPTMMPTPIIRIGSMMDVSDWMLESTSSS